MLEGVNKHMASCSTCAQAKTLRTLPAGWLIPLPTPQHPWLHLAVDFITDLPVSQGNTVILVVLDGFSCSLCLIPLPALPAMFKLVESMHIFCILENIVSD